MRLTLEEIRAILPALDAHWIPDKSYAEFRSALEKLHTEEARLTGEHFKDVANGRDAVES